MHHKLTGTLNDLEAENNQVSKPMNCLLNAESLQSDDQPLAEMSNHFDTAGRGYWLFAQPLPLSTVTM